MGAAAVTGEGQVAGAMRSEALAEADLPKDYCCLQVAYLTHLIVVICTSHAERSRTHTFSLLSQIAPTRAARPLGQIQLCSAVLRPWNA